jgi:pimeloyl-ACP methyl ester carboxylesterase
MKPMASMEICIVLAHGIFGWGDVANDTQFKREYFYGFREFVEEKYRDRPDVKFTIAATTVFPSESVEARGHSLATQIQNLVPSGVRAHVIAHSMGGLDSRWAIAKEGLADKIASLTTIATPNRGTTVGTVVYPSLPDLHPVVNAFSRTVDTLRLTFGPVAGTNLFEFYDHLLVNIRKSSTDQITRGVLALTLEGARQFNAYLAPEEAAVRDRTQNRVSYFAYGGNFVPGPLNLLRPSYDLIMFTGIPEERQAGNDGAVSVWSAHYPWDKDYVRTIPFDHFTQINWSIPETRPIPPEMDKNLKALYREILESIVRVQRDE